jgi:WhiB family redox-sensing transcriptional regulator
VKANDGEKEREGMSIELGDVFPGDYPDFEEFGNPPCSETAPDAFFPEDLDPDSRGAHKAAYRMERQARAICNACPYKQRCLDYALTHRGISGIWGGTTDIERGRLRRSLGITVK